MITEGFDESAYFTDELEPGRPRASPSEKPKNRLGMHDILYLQ